LRQSFPSNGVSLYRLGDDKVVRLPRIQAAAGQVDKENQWLPRLAPLVTLPIPVPLAKGTPGDGFPWSWSVYRWIEGEIATIERIANLRQTATEMAQFIAAFTASILRVGQLPVSTTLFEVCHWQPETLQPAPPSRTCAERSMKSL
jgi:aminoglycoside phosphotransferase (APT) family kinase protein